MQVIFEPYDKIKEHIKRHKEAYIVGAAGVGLATITYAITRRRHAENAMRSEIHDGVVMRFLNIFSKQEVVSVIERSGRGHPGYLTRCLETGEIFDSQSQAADLMGISRVALSEHIRGNYPDVNGYHFEHVNVR